MPEDPKEFPQTGADGAGQIGKQDWELPHSVSAPPDGFSPNVETASYGGHDESITDYHPPVEQGEVPHPFKVNRFKNEDDESKVRVRLGRFYYGRSIVSVGRIPPHGPHNAPVTATGQGGDDDHTHPITPFDGPYEEMNTEALAGAGGLPHHWPVNKETEDDAETPISYWTITGADTEGGYFDKDYLLVNSIPYSFRTLGVGPETMGSVNEVISDYIEFDSIPEASSVWLRYVIDISSPTMDLAGLEGLDVVYVKDVLDGTYRRSLPTSHGPVSPLTMANLVVGDPAKDEPQLARKNPLGWDGDLPPGMLESTYTRPPSPGIYFTMGCYYIRLASLPAEGDEETFGGGVQQVIYDNIYYSTTWFTSGATGRDAEGKGYGIADFDE